MKVNSETVLAGERIVLVPYKKEHVPRYHDWMQSPELLEQTASERLTLDQEYEMQQSWFHDENKCTFIILDKNKWLQTEMAEIECMAGDVNLFFDDCQQDTAEIEIMIAEPSCRRCGLGREALLTMMNYGVTNLGVQKYVAKIGCDNKPSLTLFHTLGFTEVSVSEVFKEITLEMQVTETVQERLAQTTKHICVHKYPYRPVLTSDTN
ncbi:N-acetyltransferase 9-like protein [Orbicella faveolata]|uniref:N-acetyltransferase 9-like protein n=1 Tax=Orbicella faveolata TaxID=48498 RepID=UPI0009E41F95|nr:N-acetyltransferase 9-like protein [Orbicella faveolata]